MALLFAIVLFLLLVCSCAGTKKASGANRLAKDLKANVAVISPDSNLLFKQLYLSSVCEVQKGRLDAAYDLIKQALTIRPHSPEALFNMGMLTSYMGNMLDPGKYEEGEKMVMEACRIDSENTDFLQTLAAMQGQMGQLEAVIDTYEKLAKYRPVSEVYHKLAELYAYKGMYEKELRTLEKIERLDGLTEQLAYSKYKCYKHLKKDAYAYKVIEDLFLQHPSELKYRVLLGDLYLEDGHPRQAYLIYKDVLTVDSANSYGLLSMLAYYFQTAQDSLYLAEAPKVLLNPHMESHVRSMVLESYLKQIVKLKNEKENETALSVIDSMLSAVSTGKEINDLCQMFFLNIKLPMLRQKYFLEKILLNEPENISARTFLTQWAINKQDIKKTLSLCQEGIKYTPSEILFYFYAGVSEMELNNEVAALDYFKRGVEHIPTESQGKKVTNNGAEIYSEICAAYGDALYKSGQKKQTFEFYEKALKYNPDNYDCLNNYAYYLSEQKKDLAKAEEMGKKAADANPKNLSFVDTYVWTLYLNGKYEQAEKYLTKALQSNQDAAQLKAVIYLHAGDIMQKCGNMKKALEYWRKSYEIETDKQIKKQLRRKISNGKVCHKSHK